MASTTTSKKESKLDLSSKPLFSIPKKNRRVETDKSRKDLYRLVARQIDSSNDLFHDVKSFEKWFNEILYPNIILDLGGNKIVADMVIDTVFPEEGHFMRWVINTFTRSINH